MRLQRGLASSWAVGLVLLLTAPTASAHAIGVQARPIEGSVRVEGYYDDDTPTQDAVVTVLDANNHTVATGRTDETGVWSFPTPPPGRYRIVIDAGDGHRATTTLVIAPDRATPPVSDGPSRAEFTRTPWERITLGLVLIVGLTLLAHRLLRQPPPQSAGS